MEDTPPGEGWWKASDGSWYPPEQHPDYAPPTPPAPPGAPPAPPSAPPAPSAPTAAAGGGTGGPVIANPVDNAGGAGGGPGKGVAIIAGVLVVIALAAAAFFLTQGDDETADSGPGTTEEREDEPDTTDEDGTTTETVESTTTTEEEPEAAEECRYAGVDSFDDVQTELEFTNPLGTVGSLEVTYALLDEDGVRIITGSEYIESPGGREHFRIASDTLEELPPSVDEDGIECEILEIEEGFGDPLPAPGDDAECDFVELDFADDIQIEVLITNPFDETADLTVGYALRGDDVRFETSSELIEVVDPGATVREQVDTVTALPDWVDESDVTCEVLSIDTF